MIEVAIPGFGKLALRHLVLDFNGTLALDGKLRRQTRERLAELAQTLRLHVVTADTFGRARGALMGLEYGLELLPAQWQAERKREYVSRLGRDSVVAIGNGRNDRLMLGAAALGIAVTGGEGASAETIAAADIVVTDIAAALDLLTHPLRLVATLRD